MPGRLKYRSAVPVAKNRFCHIAVQTGSLPKLLPQINYLWIHMPFTQPAATDSNVYPCSTTFSHPAWDSEAPVVPLIDVDLEDKPCLCVGLDSECAVGGLVSEKISWIALMDPPGSSGTSRRTTLRPTGLKWQNADLVRCTKSSSSSGGKNVPWKALIQPCVQTTFTGGT